MVCGIRLGAKKLASVIGYLTNVHLTLRHPGGSKPFLNRHTGEHQATELLPISYRRQGAPTASAEHWFLTNFLTGFVEVVVLVT